MKLQPSIRRGLSGFFVLFSLFLLTACGALHKASSPTVPAAAPVAPADGAPTAVAAPAESAPKALPADASPSARRPISAPKAFPAESAADPDRRSDEEGLTAMDLMMLAEIAEKLDLDLDGTENLQLLAAIESWMGTPYRYGGCTRFGVDCSCLVKNLYEEVFNLDLARTSRDMFDTLEHVDPEEIREGDILVFRGRRGSRIGHVGLYLKDGKFVHASRRHGVTIGEMKNGYFRKRFVAARRAIPSKAMDLLRMLSRR
ncbi:MAG: C40 family peptidase [Desulfococcaceae bacterium]